MFSCTLRSAKENIKIVTLIGVLLLVVRSATLPATAGPRVQSVLVEFGHHTSAKNKCVRAYLKSQINVSQ
uniref:Putative secreted protein n=1 Tax=Ixodes ricinus TaxID=34613 RepID=A0A6B0TZW8_IXORI